MKLALVGSVVGIVFLFAGCTETPLPPSQTPTAQASAMLDTWSGDPDELEQAGQLLDAELAQNPRNVAALVAKARYHVDSGMVSTDVYDPAALKSARQLVEQALSIAPDSADAHLQLGYILMHGFHLKEALAEMTKAEQLDPKNPLINIALAHLHALSNQWKDAAAELHKAEPKAAGTTNGRIALKIVQARIEVHRGQDDAEALAKDYEESVRVAPDSAWTHGNYASYLLSERGMTDQALAEAEKAVSIMNYPVARHTLALAQYAKWAALRATDEKQAAEFYAKAQANQRNLTAVMGAASQAAPNNRDLALLAAALKENGVSVDAPDVNGNTPLIRAVNAEDVPGVLSLLAAGADVNQKDFMKRTPLMLATMRRDNAMAEALASHGADLEIGDEYGHRPLHLAAQTGDLAIAKTLLSHGANVNSKGYEDATPLIEAARQNSLEMVKLLVASGADTHAEMGGLYAGNALKLAELAGHKEIAEWLRSQK